MTSLNYSRQQPVYELNRDMVKLRTHQAAQTAMAQVASRGTKAETVGNRLQLLLAERYVYGLQQKALP